MRYMCHFVILFWFIHIFKMKRSKSCYILNKVNIVIDSKDSPLKTLIMQILKISLLDWCKKYFNKDNPLNLTLIDIYCPTMMKKYSIDSRVILPYMPRGGRGAESDRPYLYCQVQCFCHRNILPSSTPTSTSTSTRVEYSIKWDPPTCTPTHHD